MGAKSAICGSQALFGEDFKKALVKDFGFFWRGRLIKAGTASLAAVAVESELRNAEHATADVEQRAIHLAVVVGKDAQISAFFGAEAQGLFVIGGAEADEKEQALLDLADGRIIDSDAGMANALDKSSHDEDCFVFFTVYGDVL